MTGKPPHGRRMPGGFTARNARYTYEEPLRWNTSSITTLFLGLLLVDHAFVGLLPNWAFGSAMVVAAACAVLLVLRRIWWMLLTALCLFAAYLWWVRSTFPRLFGVAG